MENIIKNINKNKASGFDYLQDQILTTNNENIPKIFLETINEIYRKKTIPKEYNTARLIIFNKKPGEITTAQQTRPICCIPLIHRLIEGEISK